MSVEFFDLAQRLYAEQHRRPVRRLAYSVCAERPLTLAVRARTRKGSVEVSLALAGGPEEHATDRDALILLAARGATIAAPTFATLLIDDAVTLPALTALARKLAKDPDDGVRHAAALCGWWNDRTDHPGTAAVVNLISASRSTMMLGTAPAADANPAVWRRWLAVPDTGCPSLYVWAAVLFTAPLLPRLAATHADDQRSFERARDKAEAGADWTRADTLKIGALELKARCDAADLWEAALLDDPLWRQRAVYSGHVATGTVTSVNTRDGKAVVTISCDRIESRLREGAAVMGWTGTVESMPAKQFHAEVTATSICATGQLILELSGVSGRVAPAEEDHVCVLPEPPNTHQQGAARGMVYRLYDRRSWLSTGKAPPPPNRREVPLSLLVAAADDEEDDDDTTPQ